MEILNKDWTIWRVKYLEKFLKDNESILKDVLFTGKNWI